MYMDKNILHDDVTENDESSQYRLKSCRIF